MQDFLGAFRILSTIEKVDDESALLLATAANFMGASQYSLRILDRISEETRRKHPVETAQILSTNYLDVESLAYFSNIGTKLRPKPEATPSGEKALLLRCYPLIELGQLDEVLSICNYFLKSAHTPAFQAFALIFLAWTLTESGAPKKAKNALSDFENLPGRHEPHWPNTLYEQVAGFTFARLGDFERARRHLEKAWSMSFRESWQPEATWLNVLYWKGYASVLESGSFPEEWVRILGYPKATAAYVEKISNIAVIPQSLILSPSKILSRRNALHMDRLNDVLWINGRWEQGISIPMQLLSELTFAGPYGVPLFRLFDRLWPEEPLSLSTHLKRLEQSVRVLKNLKVKIIWKQNHLWVSPDSNVSVQFIKPDNAITHLQEHPFLGKRSTPFKRQEIEDFFAISQTSAKRICQNWLMKHWITQSGKGAQTLYSVSLFPRSLT